MELFKPLTISETIKILKNTQKKAFHRVNEVFLNKIL